MFSTRLAVFIHVGSLSTISLSSALQYHKALLYSDEDNEAQLLQPK